MPLSTLLYQKLPLVIQVLSFAMLLIALGISTMKTVRQMIALYQAQSFILAGGTFLTAIEPDELGSFTRLSVMPFLIVPILLAVSIEALLAQATVPEDIPILERIRRLLSVEIHRETRRQATPTWMEHRPPRWGEATSLAYNLILIALAYVIAFSLVGETPDRANSLAVSVALLLLGLFTMSSKQDIISQIMGLLVMEHGLFLAAIKVIAIPSIAVIFVVSLFLYIIITLTILIFLLPELHQLSGSIEVKDQRQLKG